TRKRKWRTTKHLFQHVPNPQCIACFRKYIEASGTRRQKLDNLDTYIFNQFEHIRHQYLSVHDIDLRRCGPKKARELNLNDFQASDGWLYNFKHQHEICSRKITKLILNTHQISIELEPHGDRTLTHNEEKSTCRSVLLLGAATHSYTIQPTITMDGCVLNPLYMCLKEVSGHISENLKKNLFNAKNIILTCSKSGKLTSSLVTYWRDQCLIPNLRSRTLLLDSLPYQVHPNVYKN
ncbi:unnamed protein product, partial [Rotaria sordida]